MIGRKGDIVIQIVSSISYFLPRAEEDEMTIKGKKRGNQYWNQSLRN
jgi:hypothetical protein